MPSYILWAKDETKKLKNGAGRKFSCASNRTANDSFVTAGRIGSIEYPTVSSSAKSAVSLSPVFGEYPRNRIYGLSLPSISQPNVITFAYRSEIGVFGIRNVVWHRTVDGVDDPTVSSVQ
jgi:hypothetical protein